MNVRTIAVAEVRTSGSQPERTCIGCRKKGPRSELLRLVAEGSGSTAVLVDERRRMAGRGAWLHPSEPCLALAVKRRAFGRALRGATGTEAWNAGSRQVRSSQAPRRLRHQPSNLKAGQKSDGNPMSSQR
ncbi:YlxR family protein [Arthrobacter nitrophenolicus]|uniref:Nucleic-acid-binding protein implicated in transcription termination n=1 Tax=Arthrobacter nitrophenolicus TaxID=683150 RepID=L8TTA1_9MICC|nr:YlxR family protein [Arthrobacter nitrophenolicus]ELT44464.1 nucleic-acid-binding protein implicated in transcription termination [Arthrobacter nitrophenolicus]